MMDISLEDTDIGQEHTWLQDRRGGGGAVEIWMCRHVAAAEEGEI